MPDLLLIVLLWLAWELKPTRAELRTAWEWLSGWLYVLGVILAEPEIPANDAGPARGGDVTGVKFTVDVGTDAPSCHECGAIMVRNGSCYKCNNCGSTSGCS